MATMSLPRADSADRVSDAEGQLTHLRRWLRVWIALLVVATLTVVAFLVLIAMALSKVDDNVALADRRVSAVRANVSVLPGLVHTINGHLAAIDRNLAPVPGRVRRINDSLGAVDDDLGTTSRSLSDTASSLNGTQRSLSSTDSALAAVSGSLGDTHGSLKDTESLLVSVRVTAGDVESTLEDAESPADKLGAKDIYQRVARANAPLRQVHGNTGNVLHGLVRVNRHLHSICESPTLQALAGFPPC